MEAKCCIVSELQGLKFGQSGPLGTFGSHFGQHFARFEHQFYFQKCSPWWALSAQPNKGGGGVAMDRQLDRWHHRMTCRVAPCEQQGATKNQTQMPRIFLLLRTWFLCSGHQHYFQKNYQNKCIKRCAFEMTPCAVSDPWYFCLLPQGPAVMCKICHQEGHLKMACPEEHLPPVPTMPPLTEEYERLLNHMLWRIPGLYSRPVLSSRKAHCEVLHVKTSLPLISFRRL